MRAVLLGGAGILCGLVVLRASTMESELVALAVPAALFAFIAVLSGNIRKLLLAGILLELPLQLDINLSYLEEWSELGALGGLNLSVTTLALAVLYALWFGEIIVTKRSHARTPGLLRASLPLLGYVTLVAISVGVARHQQLALFEVALLLQMLLLYIYLLYAVRSYEDVGFVVTILLAGVVVEGLVMSALLVGGESFSFVFLHARIDGTTGRIAGTIGASNYAGAYLGFLAVVAVAVFLNPLNRWHKVLAGFAFALGGIFLILTGSRGAWLGFVVAMFIVCVGAWRRGRLSPMVPAAFLLGGVFVAVVFQDFLATRLFPEDQTAALGRVPLMQLAFRMITDNPILGVGANNFAVRIEEYALGSLGQGWLFTVHNKYLLVWSETGFFALLFFMLFLIVTLRYGWKNWREGDERTSLISLGIAAGILGHMVHLNIDIFHGRGQVELLWVMSALLAAIYRLPKRAPESSEADRLSTLGMQGAPPSRDL